MERICLSTGPILLVGEGNFSLTVALLNKVPPVTTVATTLLDESQISIHATAPKHIHMLKLKGVEVLLGIDATSLQEYPQLQGRQFACIIFNFPHVGGKSNLKKNRQLLKDFFSSAVQVLHPDGQIMVTLCKGQGGTPADQPMRSWSDSWQVVAMAAYADLILHEVVPFRAEDLPAYDSTGFRSQDKFFHTEGAKTHVFVKCRPLVIRSDIPRGLLEVGGQNYTGSAFIIERIHRYKELSHNVNHPVTKLEKELHRALGEHFHTGLYIVPEDSYPPCTLMGSTTVELPQGSSQSYTFNICDQKSAAESVCGTCSTQAGLGACKEDPPRSQTCALGWQADCEGMSNTDPQTVLGCGDTEAVDYSQQCQFSQTEGSTRLRDIKTAVLQTTLLQNIKGIVHTPACTEGRLCLLSGMVGQQCLLKPSLYPVHREMLGLVKQTTTTQISDFQTKLSAVVHNIFHTSNSLAFHLEKPTDKQWNIFESVSAMMVGDTEIGICGRLNPMWTEQVCHVFLLNLDSIAQVQYNIADIRLLWSEDERLWTDAKENGDTLQGGHRTIPFQPYSLFPPKWQHDISFWLPVELSDFDELSLHEIVREICGDAIVEVKHLDTYTREDTHRTSLCYKEIYQSCDRALSYQESHQMQKHVRLILAEKLKIQLR